MTDAGPEFTNFIIAGAGPAGLTAGIAAARNGLKAVILEKGKTAGPRPRGEGIGHYPLLDDILGDDFIQTECFKSSGGSVFHSPGDLNQVKLAPKNPVYFFEWRTFIDRLVAVARALGVEIRYQSEVLDPIFDDNHMVAGVRYKDDTGTVREIHGNVTLGCDGHRSTVGSHFNIPYHRMNCAMVKCLAGNANITIEKTPDLQFYFIGHGDLPYAQDFPQCVAYAFPIGGQKMELGLMLRMAQAHKINTMKVPSSKTIWKVWNKLKIEYPGFSSYFKGAQIEHEEITGLSNAKMVKNIIPAKGTVLIGDSAGFIDPFGSSGLYFGMAMANFWVNMLSKKMIRLSGDTHIRKAIDLLWSSENIIAYKKLFRKTDFSKHVRGSYSLIGKFEWYIFRHLGTSERINKRWNIISMLLKVP